MSPARLFDYWRSTASYRVRIALHLLGIPFEPVPVDLLAGEQASEAHLERNPQGFVPVLEIDGLRLTQSLAIIEYLDETRTGGLLPGTARERARVRALSDVIAMDTHPLCAPSVLARVTEGSADPEAARHDWMRHFIRRGLAAFDALLEHPATGPYCHGGSPGLADLCLVPQLYNATRWGVDVADLHRVRAVAEACAAIPAFAAAQPRQPIAQT